MAEEERLLERVDKGGSRWTKVYFGSGGSFQKLPGKIPYRWKR